MKLPKERGIVTLVCHVQNFRLNSKYERQYFCKVKIFKKQKCAKIKIKNHFLKLELHKTFYMSEIYKRFSKYIHLCYRAISC